MTIHEQIKEARAKYLYAVLMLENKMEEWERKEYQQLKDDNLKKIVDLIDLLEPTLETILSAEVKPIPFSEIEEYINMAMPETKGNLTIQDIEILNEPNQFKDVAYITYSYKVENNRCAHVSIVIKRAGKFSIGAN